MPSNPLIHGIITNICDIIIYRRGTLSVTYTHLHIVRGTLSVTHTHLHIVMVTLSVIYTHLDIAMFSQSLGHFELITELKISKAS